MSTADTCRSGISMPALQLRRAANNPPKRGLGLMHDEPVDVLIVGSGHAGGMAAKILTEKGISCLVLDAGPEMDYERDRTNKPVYELPYRGFNKPGRLPHVIQANEFNANQWVDEVEVPYT